MARLVVHKRARMEPVILLWRMVPFVLTKATHVPMMCASLVRVRILINPMVLSVGPWRIRVSAVTVGPVTVVIRHVRGKTLFRAPILTQAIVVDRWNCAMGLRLTPV
jgi:hypothetical protein